MELKNKRTDSQVTADITVNASAAKSPSFVTKVESFILLI